MRRKRKGMVLPFVIAIAMVLALLGISMLKLGLGSRIIAAITTMGMSARSAADAGIAQALYEMNSRFQFGQSWDNSWLPYQSPEVALDNSNASYSFYIAEPNIGADGEYYWQVESRGISGREEKRVYAKLEITNLFDYGLIVTDSIDLKQDTLIDAYDSNDGPYGPFNSGRDVKIGTTYAGPDPRIILRNNVVITGDVLVGVGGNTDEIIRPLGTPGPTMNNRYSLPQQWDFEPILINVPPTAPSGSIDASDFTGPSLTIGDPSGTTITYWRYSNINIPNDSRLIVMGPVELHVTGNINLGTRAEIYVGGDPLAEPPVPLVPSSLIVYLDGNLSAGNSNGINNLTRRPRNFRLFGTGPGDQVWVIKNEGDFFGTYYAPNAYIRIYAKGEVFGSVSGRQFELKADAGTYNGMHYDMDLSTLNQYDTGFAIDRWWEKARPPW